MSSSTILLEPTWDVLNALLQGIVYQIREGNNFVVVDFEKGVGGLQWQSFLSLSLVADGGRCCEID